jgi:hypothetical protein
VRVRTRNPNAPAGAGKAAATCKAAFRTKYGKGAKHRDAFRRCVKAQLAA